MRRRPGSDFRIKVEEGIQAALELSFNLLARTLDKVHGDVSLVAVGQLEGRILDLHDLAFGEQPQSVDKSQIGHKLILVQLQG